MTSAFWCGDSPLFAADKAGACGELNVVLFDDPGVRSELLPLSYTRPVAEFLLGITSLRAKWEHYLPGQYSWHTVDYLRELYPMQLPDDPEGHSVFIAANVVASPDLAEEVGMMGRGCLVGVDQRGEKVLVAVKGTLDDFHKAVGTVPDSAEMCSVRVRAIRHIYDVFLLNGQQVDDDFHEVTRRREGQSIPRSCTVIGDPDEVFIESRAVVEGVVLNASHGPIYIGPGTEVMEGSCVRGPVSLGPECTVNMGTKIYPGTSLGPHTKVGGELNNVVIFGFTNKAHDGFLGNAVIGEWCNLGAGCVASNLKNDYSEIKLWNYPAHRFLKTGLQFCGLIMGDHSKAGINTMFNTATVVGVGVNIHGTGFPRNFVASFQEGGAQGFSEESMDKFFSIAQRMMARRHKELTEADRRMFMAIRTVSEQYR